MPQQQPTQKRLSAGQMSRIAKARVHEFAVLGKFEHGYRNKEDISNLPPNVMVVGSQNVLTNSAEQIAVRNGYQLDGPAGDQNTYGIDSAFDFNTHINGIRNLRKWGTTLQMRHINPSTLAVSWITLISTLLAANVVNFCEYWDANNENKNLCLFVNGNNNIYEFTGGLGSYLSSTSNTITVSGATSLSNLNFYTNSVDLGKMHLLINGVDYTYTGGGTNGSIAFSQTPTNANVNSTPTTWNSQLFTTGATAQFISTATVRIKSSASSTISANVTAGIYTNNAGAPGTLVGAVAIASIPGSFSAGDFDLTFTFNEAISPLTNYHFVVYTNFPSNLQVYIGASGGVGTNVSTNSGSTWSAENGYLYCTVNELDTTTQTFTGVTPDPTGAGIAVGDAIVQPPVIGTASVRNCTLTQFDLISNFGNQIYYGAFNNQTVFISKVNQYQDCTVSTPRVVGEGANAVLDAPPVGFAPQDDSMLLTAGISFWYQSKFVLSADLANESFTFGRLKTTSKQAAQSQALINKMKNNVIFISNEPIFNSLGTVQNFLNSPQATNMSDSIKYDMNAYDFTGGSVYYDQYYLYFTIPTLGVVRMYNLEKKYWEAPQLMPISFFYQVDGVLYGHSSLTNESYQVFVADVYNDNGNPISVVAAFPYVSQVGGSAPQKKNFNKHYTEGYIAGNTQLTLTINYDFGGFSGNYSTIINGANPAIIFNKITDGSLGQNTLGLQPIGAILNLNQQPTIPKFRVINTFPRKNVFEYQLVYSSNEVDQNWAILRFGPAVGSATDGAVEVTE